MLYHLEIGVHVPYQFQCACSLQPSNNDIYLELHSLSHWVSWINKRDPGYNGSALDTGSFQLISLSQIEILHCCQFRHPIRYTFPWCLQKCICSSIVYPWLVQIRYWIKGGWWFFSPFGSSWGECFSISWRSNWFVVSQNNQNVSYHNYLRNGQCDLRYRTSSLDIGILSLRPLAIPSIILSYSEDKPINHFINLSKFVNTHTHTHTHTHIYIYLTTQNSRLVKSVDQFSYLDSNISSTECNVCIHLTKAWNAIVRLLII